MLWVIALVLGTQLGDNILGIAQEPKTESSLSSTPGSVISEDLIFDAEENPRNGMVFSAEVLPKKHEKNMTWVQILSNPAEDVI